MYLSDLASFDREHPFVAIPEVLVVKLEQSLPSLRQEEARRVKVAKAERDERRGGCGAYFTERVPAARVADRSIRGAYGPGRRVRQDAGGAGGGSGKMVKLVTNSCGMFGEPFQFELCAIAALSWLALPVVTLLYAQLVL